MKITPELVKYIQNAIKLAQLVGIEELIIEPGMVRGMDTARTVAIIQDSDVPELPCGALGITRLNVLNSRINVVGGMEDFNVDVTVKDGTTHAFSLTLKAKGTKIDYRCGDPTLIQAKRKINDPLRYKVSITPEMVDLLNKGMSAMSATSVAIICNSEGVSFELVDNNNDIFKHVFAETVETVDGSLMDTPPKFAYRYSAKLLLSVLKKEPTYFEIGTVGLLKVVVDGLSVLLIPVE
jgi:hypothetical protein